PVSRTSSAVSPNPRISPAVSTSPKESSCMEAPQDSVHRDRLPHPTTILLRKSQSKQPGRTPDLESVKRCGHGEAFTICFKMLQDMSSADPFRLKYIIKKVKNTAHGSPSLVMETIHHCFIDNPEISSRHKFWLFQTLEMVIGASDIPEETWEKTFTQLALENTTKTTELADIHQDEASSVRVAICRHSWRVVAQHLETELLTGIFPHRSLLYVRGILSPRGALRQGRQACWEEQLSQKAIKSVPFLNMDVWSKVLWALTTPSQTQQEQSPEKVFLFTYYGLILQAKKNCATVKRHLQALLEMSHQRDPGPHTQGMALTMGLAAAHHLDGVWAVLDQFGQSRPIRWSLHSFPSKDSKDLHWKWASSTILLAHGQVAAKAHAHILPWVDSIVSRIYPRPCPLCQDETLRQSFLTASLMLTGALSRSEGAHSYKFSQTSELLQCLMVLMQKEPQDTLCTQSRHAHKGHARRIHKLRPPIASERKSQLSTCSRSTFGLPLLDALEKHTCLFLEPPNIQVWSTAQGRAGWTHRGWGPGQLPRCSEHLQVITDMFLGHQTLSLTLRAPQHLYVWLASEKAHERQRAVHNCMILKFLNHGGYLDPEENYKHIGQLVGILRMLCQIPDRVTQRYSLEGASHLYQLLMCHKAGEGLQAELQSPKELSQAHSDEAPLWSSGDQKATPLGPQEMAKNHFLQLGSSQVIEEIMQQLTLEELNDLVWTAIDGLGSTSPFRVQAASEMLLAVIQQHGAKQKTVASMGRAIRLHLCSLCIPQAKEDTLHAITLLARSHTPELVATFLDISMPLDSHTFLLWRTLEAKLPMSHLALATLPGWLQERPLPTDASDSSPHPKERTSLRLLAVSHEPLHELQSAQEFKQATQEAYPEILPALLTQVYYVLELNLPGEPQPKQQAQEAAVLSPQSCSTSLEALKSLLSTTGHWHVFAHLRLQSSWELFTTIHTYPKGVGLLARAMVQNHCRQLTAVLYQLLPRLQSPEDRERKVAILILTEVGGHLTRFLYGPALLEVLPKPAALTGAHGLWDPSTEVRVSSLQGLGNVLFHPAKGSLLRGQLRPFLNGFFQSSKQVVVCIMNTVSDTLHRLGAQGMGFQSLRVAVNTRSFFDDKRDGTRAAAMALFGDLVAVKAGREPSGLRTQVHQSMVPLLLHLKDRCPAVAMEPAFFAHCFRLLPLRWRLRHTLFCTLAWERGLSTGHFLWTCLMPRSQEEFSIHLSQALSYPHSHSCYIKTWAALFISYTICYHPKAVSQTLNAMDTNLLFHSNFEDLKSDPEPSIRESPPGGVGQAQAV
uniref:Maestro heat like repeat family member 5/pseudo n=1 Tax=Saimiri boliviensis boliviensis TaxID=39432 RepID=A0A2K6TTW7_SAIBB